MSPNVAVWLWVATIFGFVAVESRNVNAEIFYTYDSSMIRGGNAEVEECVQTAIELLESHSCLFFSKFDLDMDKRSSSTVTFQLNNSTDRCHIHKTNVGAVVSLGSECGSQLTTCVRLILRSFGWPYEHQRFDRNEFIIVNTTNILTEFHKDFLPQQETLWPKISYDLSSVMHFSSREFAKQSAYDVLTVKNTLMIPTISSRHRDLKNLLSFRDRLKLNAQFACASHCAPQLCSHQGYLDSSCRCVCPDGFSGSSCEHLKRQGYYKVSGCGFLSNESGVVKSPGFPSRYPHAVFCEWVVEGERESDRIAFRLDHLDLEFEVISKPTQDCLDTLRIYPHGTDVATKPIACRPDDVLRYQSKWFLSQHNWLFIGFRSDPWGTFNHSGFSISYKILRANEDIISRRGLISFNRSTGMQCSLMLVSLLLFHFAIVYSSVLVIVR